MQILWIQLLNVWFFTFFMTQQEKTDSKIKMSQDLLFV